MDQQNDVANSRRKTRTAQIVYIITILISVLCIWFGNHMVLRNGWFKGIDDSAVMPVEARVEKILSRDDESYSMDGVTNIKSTQVNFRAKILSGDQKGKTVDAFQTNDSFMAQAAKEVQVGDKIILYYVTEGDSDVHWSFGEYVRIDKLAVLCAVFFLFLLIFGRKKGFNTIISLVFTALAVFAVFVPSILSGYNIYLMSILTCIFTTVMTLLIVNGPDSKSLASAVGCVGGVLVAGILTLVMDHVLGLTGMIDENSVYLRFLDMDHPIDLKAIIFAAIILGALGAIMDVAMSIASSIREISLHAERPTFRSLMKSGMTIGRDIMGTMSNTLVLAYIGSSLSVVVLLIAYNSSVIGLLNKEMLVVEIMQTLIGSIGILFTIPLTSIFSAFLYMRHKKHPVAVSAPPQIDQSELPIDYPHENEDLDK